MSLIELIERLREETVLRQDEPTTLIMPDGTTTECPGAVTTMRRNRDGPEAADRLEAMQAEIDRYRKALGEISVFAANRTKEAPGFGLIVRATVNALHGQEQ